MAWLVKLAPAGQGLPAKGIAHIRTRGSIVRIEGLIETDALFGGAVDADTVGIAPA
jgi:hypothetical protein